MASCHNYFFFLKQSCLTAGVCFSFDVCLKEWSALLFEGGNILAGREKRNPYPTQQRGSLSASVEHPGFLLRYKQEACVFKVGSISGEEPIPRTVWLEELALCSR